MQRLQPNFAELTLKTKSFYVDCLHAARASRPTLVKCELGLYGGKPHMAVCKQCSSRKPINGNLKNQESLKRIDLIASQENDHVADNSKPPLVAFREVKGPEVAAKSAVDRIVLRSNLSPGDIIMLTATVRDLHKAHPGRFVTAVETTAMEIWEHNPMVVPHDRSLGGWRVIDMHYPLVNQSNQMPVHFLRGYTEYFEAQTGLAIPASGFRGDIYLSDQERGWMNQVEERFGYRGKFWIMMGGGKYDFTTKWWPSSYYQTVVDQLAGRIQFVQCGQKDHWHPRLHGVFDLVGETSIRQFIRLMHHAEGVICPVTFAMHLAAAVPTKTGRLRPCVVIAGGREPPHWEAYPGHQFLHTVGCLPCCSTGGCWKSRCQPVGDGDRKDKHDICERPVQVDPEVRVPQCMTLIQPQDVVRAVERAMAFA